MEFAQTVATPEGACEFVGNYGPLVSYTLGVLTPSDINYIIVLINNMKTIVDEWRNGGLVGRRPDGAPPLPTPGLEAVLRQHPGSIRNTLYLTPDGLLRAMELQFLQTVSNDTQLRKCAICPTWFSYGTGTGRRKSAHYCSDRCRKAAHRRHKAEKNNG